MLAPDIFRLLFPVQYLVAAVYAPPLLIGSTLLCAELLLRKSLIERGDVTPIPFATAIAAGIGLPATLVLTSMFGLMGAVAGYLVTAAASFGLFLALIARRGGNSTFPTVEFLPQIPTLLAIGLYAGLEPEFWVSMYSLFARLGLGLVVSLVLICFSLLRNRSAIAQVVRLL